LLPLFFAAKCQGEGKRFVMGADEKLTAFLEVERVTGESFRFQNAE
jgi:hypothetical protein